MPRDYWTHRDEHRAIVENRRQRLLAQGLCIVCGKERGEPGPRGKKPTHCPECRKKATNAVRDYQRRKAERAAKVKEDAA